MELKTLKDFEKEPDVGECLYQLKQEAIKWIKKLDLDYAVQEEQRIECADCGVDDELSFIGGKIDWIKTFFNIKESDLK